MYFSMLVEIACYPLVVAFPKMTKSFANNRCAIEGPSMTKSWMVKLEIWKISLLLLTLYQEYIQTWGKKLHHLYPHKWSPPPINCYSFSFDATIRDIFKMKEVVCHNSEGKVIEAWISKHESTNPGIGKATASLKAVQLATPLHLKSINWEGDALKVTTTTEHANITTDWKISPIIEDIHLEWKQLIIEKFKKFINHKTDMHIQLHNGSRPILSLVVHT